MDSCKMKKILIMFLALLGCTKPKSNVYTVKAGRHRSDNRRLVLIKNNTVRFNFEVNDTWLWEEGLELSKVCGLSFGDPLKNSIRLAVRSYGDYVKFYAFAHVDGEIIIKEFYGEFKPDYLGYCEIRYSKAEHYYNVLFDMQSVSIEAKQGLKHSELCYPYIGGDYTIDHDWIVPIEFY